MFNDINHTVDTRPLITSEGELELLHDTIKWLESIEITAFAN